jgi:transglutaminase-like putative cysteine protease
VKEYLKSTDIINWQHPEVVAKSKHLAKGKDHPQDIINTCFEWVHDEICHSSDYQMNPVTCRASDVLKFGTGYCYAKSHLLAALLRANSIPTGLCYQRLSVNDNGEPYCLHGLNAVYLPEIGWYRLDPRGNKPGVNAQFSPPTEQLAFALSWEGEAELPDIYADPLPIVIQALKSCETWQDVLENLPDLSELADRR